MVGRPFTGEGGSFLGTDYLGQDVWSRVLYGGQSVLITAVLATALGVVIGGLLGGVTAAYAGGWLEEILMRTNDVFLALPQILVTLLVLSAVHEPAAWIIVLLVGLTHVPRVARVARGGVALPYVTQDFVLSAEALGESRARIVIAELGPNLVVPMLAETGLRLTYSIGMVAAIGFLGFSSDVGAADWGADDQREPVGAAGPALGGAGPPGADHRPVHHRDQPDRRRTRQPGREGSRMSTVDAAAAAADEAAVAQTVGLRVELTRSGIDVVDDLNLDLYPGHILGAGR